MSSMVSEMRALSPSTSAKTHWGGVLVANIYQHSSFTPGSRSPVIKTRLGATSLLHVAPLICHKRFKPPSGYIDVKKSHVLSLHGPVSTKMQKKDRPWRSMAHQTIDESRLSHCGPAQLNRANASHGCQNGHLRNHLAISHCCTDSTNTPYRKLFMEPAVLVTVLDRPSTWLSALEAYETPKCYQFETWILCWSWRQQLRNGENINARRWHPLKILSLVGMLYSWSVTFSFRISSSEKFCYPVLSDRIMRRSASSDPPVFSALLNSAILVLTKSPFSADLSRNASWAHAASGPHGAICCWDLNFFVRVLWRTQGMQRSTWPLATTHPNNWSPDTVARYKLWRCTVGRTYGCGPFYYFFTLIALTSLVESCSGKIQRASGSADSVSFSSYHFMLFVMPLLMANASSGLLTAPDAFF